MGLDRLTRHPAFGWIGWTLAILLALATAVQTLRLARGPEQNPRAGGPPPRAGGPPPGPAGPSPPRGPTAPGGIDLAAHEAAREEAERLEAQGVGDQGADGRYACSLVVGFSQTSEWYLGAGGFEEAVDDGRWELLWVSGASIDRWADPAFVGWRERIRSPCVERPDDPDRVVLTITGAEFRSDLVWWTREIRAAVALLRDRFPGAERIVLQSVVGGPDNRLCSNAETVRASFNHPFIDLAIAEVAGGDVVVGPSPEVRSCGDFRDVIGHLSPTAAGPVGREIAGYFEGAGG